MVKQIVVVQTVEENPELSLEDICRLCGISKEMVYDIIQEGVVDLETQSAQNLRFNERHLKRIRTMARLYHDLDINVAGGAMIVEMIEEMEKMREQLSLLQKYFHLS